MPFLSHEEYHVSNVIFIEEGQFFPDLLEFVKVAVDQDCKTLIVCGLDGDFQRQPIGQMLDLIPLADSVDKLKALCAICKNGTEGLFSLRKIACDWGSGHLLACM
ncbi:hypothetical protein HDV02_002920 [Globomyces sp. JEL0801]|nr:hypothetical protein HDV02_002920 [Globomyces sp. JEL0801]